MSIDDDERALAREHASTLLKQSLDHAIWHGAKAWGELSDVRTQLAALQTKHEALVKAAQIAAEVLETNELPRSAANLRDALKGET